jgi:hypothetical protein
MKARLSGRRKVLIKNAKGASPRGATPRRLLARFAMTA